MKTTFEELYDKYHTDLYQFIFYMVKNKENTEDIVQEVYVKVLESYQTFKGDSSEKTWLFSIARHVTIDFFRKQQRKKKRILDFFNWSEKGESIPASQALPEEIAIQNEELKQVFLALDDCTEDQRSVIILRYIQSFSIKETASVLGWTESKVKTTQHRAISQLKEHIDTSTRKENSVDE
ncbi:RNA polymerase sigma factor SigX [Saliterribacillus persicus]|uniref:RNA polymerase sigma factor n=1 Tax=Saliterribacillus persicus TaxID=930114 RepID=A0A368XAY1_9BACI|nr:RNA polymerase sigma factor SigX [Saliterribacillus persicus]RCW64879.1 RNA polymerase sigma (SigX) subunit [Saliterribacillus persicus]